jgi:hypothetical protein
MAEIINLRRARKARERTMREATAAANRIKSGTPKALRGLEKARSDKRDRDLESRRLDDGSDDEGK